eukprot:TRINITY_DN13237_c0_g1_i2.p1 TRINITY_DN13237_c0_g1~~TRINITY_DN13237_c0_g1_i2.p1  ORF type:complete len:534 (+),score=56.05 TRINITY_DN13237_c0_g1_i2:67-1602(+)
MAPKLHKAVNKSMKNSMKGESVKTTMKVAKPGPPMKTKAATKTMKVAKPVPAMKVGTAMKATKPVPAMKVGTAMKATKPVPAMKTLRALMKAAATKQTSAMKKRVQAKATKKNAAKKKTGNSTAAMKRAAVSKKVTTSKKSQFQKPAENKAAKTHSPFFLPFKYNLENYLADIANLPRDVFYQSTVFGDPIDEPYCPCLEPVFGACERNGELVVEQVRVKNGWGYDKSDKGRIGPDHIWEIMQMKYQQFGIWNGPCSPLVSNYQLLPLCAESDGRFTDAHGPQAYVPAGTAVKSPSGTEESSLWCGSLGSVAQLASDVEPAFGGLYLRDHSDGQMFSGKKLGNPKVVASAEVSKLPRVWNSDRYYFPLFVDSQGCRHVLLVSSDKNGLKDAIVYATGDDLRGSWHVVEDRGLKTYIDFNFGFCGSVDDGSPSRNFFPHYESHAVLFTKKHLHCYEKDLDAEGLPKELNGKIRGGSRKEVIDIFLHLRELMKKSKTVAPLAAPHDNHPNTYL